MRLRAHARHPRSYAIRKPTTRGVTHPGDLVQLDTMHLRPLPGAERGIALSGLPPRSPKLNGHVERASGTHRREFWECYDGNLELPALTAALRTWEAEDNAVQPHQALVYLTTTEYLSATAERRL